MRQTYRRRALPRRHAFNFDGVQQIGVAVFRLAVFRGSGACNDNVCQCLRVITNGNRRADRADDCDRLAGCSFSESIGDNESL